MILRRLTLGLCLLVSQSLGLAATTAFYPQSDTNPQSLGSSVFSNTSLTAGRRVELSQTYTLGKSLSAGSKIATSRFWQDGEPLQNQFPKEANFVKAHLFRGGAKVFLTPAQSALKGKYGGLSQGLPAASFQIEAVGLNEGDRVIFEYSNLNLPRRATQHFVLPVLIKPVDSDAFLQAPVTALIVRGGPVVNVAFDVPSYIRPGSTFDAQLRTLDEYGNLASGSAPSFDILIDGSFVQRIDAGLSQTHTVYNLQLPEAGKPPSIEVRSSGGGIKRQSSAFIVKDTRDKVHWLDVNAIAYPETAEGRSLDDDSDELKIPGLSLRETTTNLWTDLQEPKGWIEKRSLEGGGQQLVISPNLPNISSNQLTTTKIAVDKNSLVVALPEVPLDDRVVNNVQLVEILTGNGGFEWYGQHLLNRGYRLGFTASNNANTVPIGITNKKPRTGVIVKPNETPLEALRQGRTFVTSGDKIMLDVKVNGADPGSRAAPALKRVIQGQVAGTAQLSEIELLKNGVVIDQYNFSTRRLSETNEVETQAATEILGDSRRVKISFASSSKPALGQRDLPRNGREWIGFVKTDMVDISGLTIASFTRPAIQAAIENPRVKNRVDFITWTRGDSSSFILQLDSVSEDAIVELNLREGQEDSDVNTLLRQPAKFASARYMVSLVDLEQGPVTRTMLVDGYQDTVTFEWLDDERPHHVSFEFTDRVIGNTQDYYYVRVKQIDDQTAWSSPVFVGGFDQP